MNEISEDTYGNASFLLSASQHTNPRQWDKQRSEFELAHTGHEFLGKKSSWSSGRGSCFRGVGTRAFRFLPWKGNLTENILEKLPISFSGDDSAGLPISRFLSSIVASWQSCRGEIWALHFQASGRTINSFQNSWGEWKIPDLFYTRLGKSRLTVVSTWNSLFLYYYLSTTVLFSHRNNCVPTFAPPRM